MAEAAVEMGTRDSGPAEHGDHDKHDHDKHEKHDQHDHHDKHHDKHDHDKHDHDKHDHDKHHDKHDHDKDHDKHGHDHGHDHGHGHAKDGHSDHKESPKFWEPPMPLQSWGQKSQHRHESWLELFFDLIFVAAAIQIGRVMKCSLGPTGLLQIYFLFSAVNHNWTSFLFYVNKFEKLNVSYLLIYFTLCGLIVLKCCFIASAATPPIGTGPDCSIILADSDWHIMLHPRNVITFHALAQMVFFALYVQVAVFNPELRTHALLAASTFAIEGIAWSISATDGIVNTGFMVMCWILGRAFEHGVWVISLTFTQPPMHLTHYASRQSVFIMIFVGESVIQIIDASDPRADNDLDWYKSSICLAFTICCCVALNYFHTQPHAPNQHVLRTGKLSAYLWFRFHSNLAFFVFSIGVALKVVFSKFGGMATYDPAYVLLCESLALSYLFSNSIRFLHKGNNRIRQRLRVYSFRFFIMLCLGFIPLVYTAALKASGLGKIQPAALLAPPALFCVVMTLADLLRRTETHGHGEDYIPTQPRYRPNISYQSKAERHSKASKVSKSDRDTEMMTRETAADHA